MSNFGIHEAHSVSQTLQRFPKTVATREFNGGTITPSDLVSKLTSAATETWNAGLTCWWSVKLSVAEVTSNSWQGHVENLAAFLAANPSKKTVLVLWHEPEDDFGASGAANYVSYFNKIDGWLKAVNPQVKTCHSANSYWYRQAGPIASPLAWRTNADIHATDVYSGNSFPLNSILPEQSAFTRWLDGLVGAGQPYSVTERGWFADSSGYATRATTIRREGDWLRDDSVGQLCENYLYWNTSGQQNDPRLVLDITGEDAVRYLSEQISTPEPVLRQITQTCPLCNGAGEYTFEFLDDTP